ncbi:hypothetical protein PFLUOLIPICF7_23005 [Pseudomonas simiae]|jgi:hypothetical protein|uniref:Uncharacterized protein n=1 Tax=Pseudomonas simiae TaxID=321846 RepID=U1TWR3_9PSED|nr:hypothetical protein PFLUOLIPICF7_23005 [Pseudomonas simiae]ERH48548.1 hypothetical protein O204_12480 [Pseudomonas simiae]
MFAGELLGFFIVFGVAAELDSKHSLRGLQRGTG